MPRSSRTPARHRRSIAAAISGLAIGVVGVSAAALPAVADPTGGGGAPPAASGPSPAAAAGGTHTVTLITGDRVRVTDLPDGTRTILPTSAPVPEGATEVHAPLREMYSPPPDMDTLRQRVLDQLRSLNLEL